MHYLKCTYKKKSCAEGGSFRARCNMSGTNPEQLAHVCRLAKYPYIKVHPIFFVYPSLMRDDFCEICCFAVIRLNFADINKIKNSNN